MGFDISQLLKESIDLQASEIFITGGLPLAYMVNGSIRRVGERLLPPDTEFLVKEIYRLASRSMDDFMRVHDDDFAFSVPQLGRFRVNTLMQRGSIAAVIRVVVFELPDARDLGIPDVVMELQQTTKGLILVTGPAGSGKSTTLACVVDQINQNRESHIITLEDPLEYIHKHKKSIVTQREIPIDTESYGKGLRAALREAPNVILLGEMRDLETISTAMSAAETGLLVLSTLHTLGAANTADRIIDSFPANQQQQVRVQLSMVLRAIVSQQLIPSTTGKPVPAFEIMLCNNAIRTMIRDSKVHQIDSIIHSSADQGMMGMDTSVLELYKKGLITAENAVLYSMNQETMKRNLGL